jgi:hypothetical protein
MMMKVDVMTTSRETLWYEYLYVKLYWFGYIASVRKTGLWSNKIKQMQKQNIEDTQYNRDTDLRGSPSVGYIHQRNCQVLPLLLSNI